MRSKSLRTSALATAVLLGCGGDASTDANTADGSGGLTTMSGVGSEGEGGGETGGSMSAGGSTSGPATAAGSEEGGGGEDSDPGPVKFDFGAIPDAGQNVGGCQPGGGNDEGKKDAPDFSYLWAANSSEGTISKIDTQTVTEVGRFRTGPTTTGSPSRTSVSLSGDVAVANRNGGITKIYALEENCQDTNGTPGIQTSVDNVPLAWDQEECRAWHIPFNYDSQRPVAWAPGTWNSSTCSWENELLWTAGRVGQGTTDEVVLIDGDAGIVLETVNIPGLKQDSFGLYGAAVDADGNLWATGWATGNHIVRVTLEDMEVTVWDGPSSTGTSSHWYGMTADVDGYIWNCGSRAARFDPATESWTVSPELSVSSGCMADGEPGGLLWMSYFGGVRGVDRTTFDVVHNFATPTSYGVSIDFFGNVWAVNGNGAHRVDPSDGTVTSYSGLNGAYTYSDMTGHSLSVVGGGTPSG
ncbi:MAG: hypothetical protein ACRBN8_01805 [Nannocystales bacterium]